MLNLLPKSAYRWPLAIHCKKLTTSKSAVEIMKQCIEFIDVSISLILTDDIVEACRNHKKASTYIKTIKYDTRSTYTPSSQQATNNIYIETLAHNTETITEICRDIISNHGLPLWQRQEIDIIRHQISDILNRNSTQRKELKQIVLQSIAEFCAEMNEENWDDNNWAYLYLRLLQNINNAIICLDKLISLNRF